MSKALIRVVFLSVCIFVLTGPAVAADLESRLQALEETVKLQQKTIETQQRTIEALKSRIDSQAAAEIPGTPGGAEPEPVRAAAVETADRHPEKKSGMAVGGLFGDSDPGNPNISLILNTFASTSNLNNGELHGRSLPGYTKDGLERENGFNLEAAELLLFGSVDPYFDLYATIPFTEHGAALEEAYFVTGLPAEAGRIKGGKFKSGFSRINEQHPHAWDFVDMPLPYRAFTGPEGIIEKGVQYTYHTKRPFQAFFGAEILQGDNETLFGGNATGGPHAWSGFARASFDIGKHSTLLFGPSVITGRTKTETVRPDSEFDAYSTLYGLEFTYCWKPSTRQIFTVQGEFLYRDQYGDLADTVLGTAARLDRSQDGLYLQGIYQWERWRVGARYDALGLFRENYSLAGEKQAFGSNPWRASGMVEFNPGEFARLRFQYTHDKSDPTGRTNHEFFLQLILGIGAHAH